uniref:Uncharacterized protein n=1 Tax=Zooxanthella nutricula TaxID=1333877 RepID=A0A7S2KHR2_9DINO
MSSCFSVCRSLFRLPTSSSMMAVLPLGAFGMGPLGILRGSVVPSHVHGVRLMTTVKGDAMERAAENAYMREEEKHQLKQLLAKKQKTQQHEEKNHDTKTLLAILGDSAKHLDEKTIEKLHEWKHSH